MGASTLYEALNIHQQERLKDILAEIGKLKWQLENARTPYYPNIVLGVLRIQQKLRKETALHIYHILHEELYTRPTVMSVLNKYYDSYIYNILEQRTKQSSKTNTH